MTAAFFQDPAMVARDDILLHRLGIPADLAGLGLFLGPSQAASLTGQAVNVDGRKVTP